MGRQVKNLVFGFLLLALFQNDVEGSFYGNEPLEQVLELIAADQGVSRDRLRVGALDWQNLPLTEKDIVRVKVINQVTGDIYGMAVDLSGAPLDLESVLSAEREARHARFGNLEPGLHYQLQKMSSEEQLSVAVWLKADDLAPWPRPLTKPSLAFDKGSEDQRSYFSAMGSLDNGEKTFEEIERARNERAEAIRSEQEEMVATIDAAKKANVYHLQEQVAVIQTPFLREMEDLGFEAVYTSPIAPLIFYELPKSAISFLADHKDIDTVYGPNDYADAMSSAKPTQKADVVDDWGFDGTGIDVGIVEDSRIEFANTYLNAGTTRVSSSTNVDDHVTAVGGIVASQHSTQQGIAQDANLFSANATDYTDANLSAAIDWAASTHNVDVLNNSWGGNSGTTDLNVHDRHLDYIVRNLWSTVVVSAGNENGGCGSGTGRVTSPARGYNVISVGNYADADSLTWSGDIMDSCSSYANPSSGMEKPEVAAVGSSITSTIKASPWIGDVGRGTTFSAAMVSGETALLMDRDSTLTDKPEVIKPIIMATALHNIEGNSQLSDYDGAGGVDMRAAFHLVDMGWWRWDLVTSASFPRNDYIPVSAGETIRIAMAWTSNPSIDYTSDPLEADLDMVLYDPDDIVVASSISSNNSYEIIEHTATKTGDHKLIISAYGFTGTSEHLGVAYWRGHHLLSPYNPQAMGTPPISRQYFRQDSSNAWQVSAIRPPTGTDYDLHLYQNSAFGNPDDHDLLKNSRLSGAVIDYVIIDDNHASGGPYYPEVEAYSGSGIYDIETATAVNDTGGTYGPYTMTPYQVIRIWNSQFTGGIPKYFAVKSTSGNADLGMALHDSDPSNSASFYQSKSQAISNSDVEGAGGSEYLNFTSATSDWLGLVVFNKSATADTTYYLYSDETAPAGSISINDGDSFTQSTAITLTLSASDSETDVTEMRLSLTGTAWSSWEPYSTTKPWTLSEGDGVKVVYVEYKNNVGMVSNTYSDTISIDSVSPTGSITINGGATYANSTSVTLDLTATDNGSGLSKMRFSNDGSSWSGWEAYASSKSWVMSSGDGLQTVYVQYMDLAGLESTTYSDDIILDGTNPTGSIAIQNGDTYVTSNAVKLYLSATDSGSGIHQMRFSHDDTNWANWENYAAQKNLTLAPGDGTRDAYVQFKDIAGNVSTSYSDSIIVDSAAPTGTIVINNGDTYATSSTVTLTLSAGDGSGSGLTQMRFSNNDISWSSWENYATTKSWVLDSGQGTRTVYVQYKDVAGNESTSFADYISLDYVAPIGTIIINGGDGSTSSIVVTLTLSANDGIGSGIAQMHFSNNGSSWSSWENFSTTKSWNLLSGDGTKTVYVQYKDNAGLVSSSYSDSIILSTGNPTGSIIINGGDTFASSDTVTLTLSADASAAQMHFSNDGSSWSGWEGYATSSTWYLPYGDGVKTVYAQFKDGAGNVSDTFTDTIILDMTLPTGSIILIPNSAYTSIQTVTLQLTAEDTGSGLNGMHFTNDFITWSSWEPFSTPKTWLLTSGDGAKLVYVQYRDLAGNLSTGYAAGISLDTTAPTGSVSINNDDAIASTKNVSLDLSANDTGAGVSDMRFSNDKSNWSSWSTYAAWASWNLSDGDGNKVVYAQYKDYVDNISSVYSDTILLDSTPPTGTILINTGDAYVSTTAVNLKISAYDHTTGLSEMRLRNGGASWSTWEPYATMKSWTLPSGDGSKGVYIEFKDGTGNVSDPFFDFITLDTTPPSGTILIDYGAAYAVSRNVILSLSANDATSGLAWMRFSNDNATWSEWEPFNGSTFWTMSVGDGVKTVYAQFKDNAGLISSAVNDSIVLDTTSPAGTILIDNGATYANSTNVVLSLSATDAGSGVAEMQFSNNDGSWSAWETYALTKSWTLASGDGQKTVNVKYKDVAGNVSGVFSDGIILDSAGPTGSIVINGGNSATNIISVTLTLSAVDPGSGVAEMSFSGDGSTWTAWESFATLKSWTLESGDGMKSVHVRYKDNLDQVSNTYQDAILLDTIAPSCSATSPVNVFSLSFEVNWSGNDSGSGIDTFDVQYRVGGSGSWTDWVTGTTTTSAVFGPDNPVSVVRGETYYFRVRAMDEAGNIEPYQTDANGDTNTYVEDTVFAYLPMVIKE